MSVEKRFSISLDVKQPTSNREIEVVEGDTGNILVVTLTDNGQPVNLTDCKVCAVFAKPNGKTAMQDTDGNGLTVAGEESNEITIELYNTSFSPGMVTCEIQVFSGEDMGTLITSAQFNFQCRRGIANEDTIQSTDEWPLLVGMLQQVAETAEEVEDLNMQTVAAAAAAGEATERANTAAENAEAITAAATAAEASRAEAEAQRVSSEADRAAAEATRQASESTRESQEQTRETNTAAAVEAADAATGRANTAAERAEQAASGVFPPHNTTHAIGGDDPITPDMIGAANKTRSTAITLLANGWEGEGPYTQTVAVEGLTGDRFENAVVFPEFSEEGLEAEREAWNLVDNTTTVEGAVYFLCLREKPIIDVPLIVKVRD